MTHVLTLTPLGDRTIRAERLFAAPPARVWRALTDPDLIRQWGGIPTHPMIDISLDFRVGGHWRYVWAAPSGAEMVAGGTYLQIESPTRFVATELFEDDWTDGPTTCSYALYPREAGTRLVLDILYTGEKGRSLALMSGMESGMATGYDQLEALLAE